MKVKKIIFECILSPVKENTASRIFDSFIMLLIFLSIISVFIMTFPVSDKFAAILNKLEHFSLIVFSIEYLMRLWTADYIYPESGKINSRLRYIVSGMAIIDLIAILPFFLPMFLPVNLVGIRAFRLLRLLRIFKFNRYSEALSFIGEVLKKKYHEMIVSVMFVFILLIIVSLLIYYAEHDAQPDKFANAFSGLWWAVATLTTVGYGDIYPITVLGKILGAIIAIMGIGMVAVPAGILSSGFVEMLEKQNSNNDEQKIQSDEKKYCPHCGKKL